MVASLKKLISLQERICLPTQDLRPLAIIRLNNLSLGAGDRCWSCGDVSDEQLDSLLGRTKDERVKIKSAAAGSLDAANNAHHLTVYPQELLIILPQSGLLTCHSHPRPCRLTDSLEAIANGREMRVS